MQYAFDEKSSLPVYIREIGKTANNNELKCLECGGIVNVRTGNKNTNYFCHKTIRDSNCPGIKTAEQKAAKLYLTAFFNKYSASDPLAIITCKCNKNTFYFRNCRAEVDFKVPVPTNTDDTPKNIIADIAILNEEKEVLAYFYLKYVDEPSNQYTGDNWFCFNTDDVLLSLKETATSLLDKVTLIDVKKCSCPRKSLPELGVKLNYCVITGDWDILSNRIMYLCKKDKSYSMTYTWTSKLNMDTAKWEETRTEFERRKQCLRCKKRHIPSIGKPYCESCLLKIVKGDNVDVINKTFPVDLLDEIKDCFKWLSEVPEPSRELRSCVQCGAIKNAKVWFYGERSICIDCVISRHQIDYPGGKYLVSKTDNLKKIILSYRVKTIGKCTPEIIELLEENRKSTEATNKKIETVATLVKDTYSFMDEMALFFKQHSIDLNNPLLDQESDLVVGPDTSGETSGETLEEILRGMSLTSVGGSNLGALGVSKVNTVETTLPKVNGTAKVIDTPDIVKTTLSKTIGTTKATGEETTAPVELVNTNDEPIPNRKGNITKSHNRQVDTSDESNLLPTQPLKETDKEKPSNSVRIVVRKNAATT